MRKGEGVGGTLRQLPLSSSSQAYWQRRRLGLLKGIYVCLCDGWVRLEISPPIFQLSTQLWLEVKNKNILTSDPPLSEANSAGRGGSDVGFSGF
jgi:hypothetical protein